MTCELVCTHLWIIESNVYRSRAAKSVQKKRIWKQQIKNLDLDCKTQVKTYCRLRYMQRASSSVGYAYSSLAHSHFTATVEHIGQIATKNHEKNHAIHKCIKLSVDLILRQF